MIKLTEEQKKDYTSILASFHTEVENCPCMACEVWEDGEITYTKCYNGKLYGLRNIHMIAGGFSESLPLDIFPDSNKLHAFVRCSNGEGAEQVRRFIKKWLNI